MSLKIHSREADSVMILNLKGRITTGEPSVTVRDAVREEIDKGFKNILLNMGEITFIDSAGLGELIAAYTTVKNRGGHLWERSIHSSDSYGKGLAFQRATIRVTRAI